MSDTLRGALADHIIDVEPKRDLPKVRAKLEEMAKHPMAEPLRLEHALADDVKRIADGLEKVVAVANQFFQAWKEEIDRTRR
jgi:hypothetical protein